MVSKLITIEGLGGTGKTHTIKKLCQEHSDRGQRMFYLTYNRLIAESTRSEITGNGVSVSTIHSLIYMEVKTAGRLPKPFSDKSDDVLDHDTTPDSFAILEQTFLSVFAMGGRDLTHIDGNPIIIIDEFQNLDDALIEIVQLICQKQETVLYLVGDRYQSIYSFRESNRPDNFQMAEGIFGRPVDEQIILDVNRRANSSVLQFLNSFLELNVPVDHRFLYETTALDFSQKQLFIKFTNKQQEFEYIKGECQRIHDETGAKVAILSRWNRNLKYFEEWKMKACLSWLDVSSIHRYIGREADTVFLVGFEQPTNESEAMVLYTGLIRAKQSLVLSTSFPACDTTALASGDVLEVIDRQRHQSKPFKALKHIKQNRNLTRGKFKSCMIDSIALVVRDTDTPFIPYFKGQGGLENNSFQRSIITEGDIPLRVTYHHGKRSFTFTLQDVNLLRANWYSDDQVVKYLSNFALAYFNYQLPLEAIKLYSIDLCMIVEQDDPLIQGLVEGNINCPSIMTDKKINLSKLSLDAIQEGTVYYNFSSARTKALTMAVYRPIDKQNKNRYFDPKAIKVELRLRKAAIQAQYAFGMEMPVDMLLTKLKHDPSLLSTVATSVLDYRTEKSRWGLVEVDDGIDLNGPGLNTGFSGEIPGLSPLWDAIPAESMEEGPDCREVRLIA